MSGHEIPPPFTAEPLGQGRPERGLGARYVAVRHSASYHERRANTWRKWAFIGWGLALGAHLALAVVMFT